MLNQRPGFSVNLWTNLPQATEHLSILIRKLVFQAQVTLINTGRNLSALWISLKAATPSTDAEASLTALLQGEIDTLVYCYHWYQA